MAAPWQICTICGSNAKEKCYRSLATKTSADQFQYCFNVLNIQGITGIACNICVNKLNRVNKLNNDLTDKLASIREQRDALIQCLSGMPGIKTYVGSNLKQSDVTTPKGKKRVSMRLTPTPRQKKSVRMLFTPPRTRTTPTLATGSTPKLITQERGTQTKSDDSRDFEVKVTVRYNDREQTRIVKGEEKSALKAFVKHKKPQTVMNSLMRINAYNHAAVKTVKRELNREVCNLLKKSAGLLNSNTEDLLNFDWKTMSKKIQSIAPNLCNILGSLLDSKQSLPKMMTSLFVLLYGRCQRFNQLQLILGLVLDQCGLTKEGQQFLHSLGIVVSPSSTLKKRKLLILEQKRKIKEIVTSYVKRKESQFKSSSTCPVPDLPLAVEATVEPELNGSYSCEQGSQSKLACAIPKETNLNEENAELSLNVPGLDSELMTTTGKDSEPETPKDLSLNVPGLDFECISNVTEDNDTSVGECFSMAKEKRILPIEVLGDNLDLTVSPSQMTIDRQRKSLHWFLVLVKQKRITADLVNDYNVHVPPQEKDAIKSSNWIPTGHEMHTLTKNFTFHVARILLKYCDFLENVRSCFPSYMTHKFVEYTKLKSVFLNCDLIEASENSSQGMIEILQRVHEIAVPHTGSDVIEKVVFGGDCLTNERAFSAQQAMQNDPSKFGSLRGVIHRPEGLHREMNFLLGIYQLFYKEKSSSNIGSLYQLRNLINRRDVTGPEDVIKSFRSHHQFVEDVTDGYIIAAVLDLLDMENVDCTPKKMPLFSLMDNEAKVQYVFDLAHQVLQVFDVCSVDCINALRKNMEALDSDNQKLLMMKCDGSFKCPLCQKKYQKVNWLRRHLQKKHDWNFHTCKPQIAETNLAGSRSKSNCPIKTFLFMSFLYRDTCDSYKMGDGDRIVLNAKLEWLYASCVNHYKYKLWLWRMLAYIIFVLDPKQAFEYKWNMTLNLMGGIENNIPNDNCVEIQVHKIKKELNAQGANKSFDSAKSICMTTQVVDGIKQQMTKSSQSHRSKRSRPSVDKSKDVMTIAKALRKKGYVGDLKWESFKDFKEPLASINVVQLNEWSNNQITTSLLYL